MNNKARNNLDRFEAFLADIDNQTKEETLAELRHHGIRTDEFLKKVNRIVDEGHRAQVRKMAGAKKCAGGDKELNTAFSAAFGRFVEMMRRKAGFSVEQLAARAGIEASEIENMEGSQDYTPEPSAVFQLARVFEIPAKRLMQLAGLTEARDQRFIRATAQFAAHSKPLSALTNDEREVLEHYIAELTAEPPSDKK